MGDNTEKAFFALLRGGLWEKEVQLLEYGDIDIAKVWQLSDEQSVVGLIAVGLENVEDKKPAKVGVLPFLGQTVRLENKNKEMNHFIGVLVAKMREAGIYTLLVKGQGIAQCYEKPLWRAWGDVDFFLSDEDYEKAKTYLAPLASSVDPEGIFSKHLGMTIDPWVVELHGSLRMGVPYRINKVLDEIKEDVFKRGHVRSWQNGKTEVFLPGPDCDAFYVFAHFFNHFYKGGIGLRQICDWCRLLWTYREGLDLRVLESRIRRAGLMSAWRAFGAFAVEYLGMPIEAMPFLDAGSKKDEGKIELDCRLRKKAERIKDFVMMSGNFGSNRDFSYYEKYPYVIRKVCSLGYRIGDLIRHARIFPLDSLRFLPSMVLHGLRSAARGE